jgi:hypothetical protein
MGNQVIVLDRDRGRVLILDTIAAGIWRRCDGKRSVRAIGDEIARSLSRSREATRQDVARVILTFEDEGLVDRTETAAL